MRCVLLCFFVFAFSSSIAADKILVLGVDSPVFDDLRERMFREEIMRSVVSLGGEVVPVMDVEWLIREKGADVRKCGYESASDFMRQCGAASFVFFSCTRNNGRLELFIYGFFNGRKAKEVIFIDAEKPMEDFFDEIAQRAAREIIKMQRER